MKIKISTVVEWISGVASLAMLALNISLVAELVRLYTEVVPDDMGSQIGNGLGKGLVLVFLIIFMAIMDVIAIIRWIMYTHRSTKARGPLKAFLIQLPFFIIFTALFVWLYSIASENIEPVGAIISALLGGLGLTFIFADVDLYVKIFSRKKKTTEGSEANDENN